MADWIIALILGLIEGLTEFLPVSSTAHLILLGKWLGFDDPTGSFKVMIQLGAILAIVVVYIRKILSTVMGLPTRAEARRFALCVVLAFLPAAFAGVLLGDLIETLFLEGEASAAAARIIATTLILGGIVMLVVERFRPQPTTPDIDSLPVWKAVAIGCCQCLALVPGVSRSGASIVGAMLLGVERRAAAEFSFFLAMPTMLGAFTYSFWKNREALDFSQLGLIGVGFVGAFIAGLIVVRLFLGIVSKYGFGPFAWYRIALGGLILLTLGGFA
jgi:undecaprenyl-diphosphatase